MEYVTTARRMFTGEDTKTVSFPVGHRLVKSLWEKFYDACGRDDFNCHVTGSLVLVAGVFWVLSLMFALIDLSGKPKWVFRYKTQPGMNEPIDRTKLKKAFKYAFINTVLISFPISVPIAQLQGSVGCTSDPDKLPSILVFIRDFIVVLLCEEVGFYYTHRAIHWGPLYKNIHKMHHEWTAPVGVVAYYCHWIEHILSNLMPLYLGSTIMGSHFIVTASWLVINTFVTVFHHSGFKLPLLPDPDYHDVHHKLFNVNFSGGYLDWLHGTDQDIIIAKRNKDKSKKAK